MNTANGRPYQYFLLLLAVILLALAGYSGYVLYPRFDLPAATGVGLLALAATAGIASLFSPCSFPLLMTLLAREAEGDDGRATRALRFAGVFALGAISFLLLTGAAIALGAAPIFARVTFTSTAGRILRATVGLVLIGLGLWQVRGQSLNIVWLNELLKPLWQAHSRLRRERRSTLGVGLYGFGYVLAGFG